jgi:hypothetical protein
MSWNARFSRTRRGERFGRLAISDMWVLLEGRCPTP